MWTIERFLPNWRELKIHESSPVPRGASARLKADAAGYLATQFFPTVPPGRMHNGVRCENLEALTFSTEFLDLHVSQDVFEHILDPTAAFQEIARTLRPGGMHIFTTPLVRKHESSQVRARRSLDGSVELLAPAEYHGNPISADGSLVTMHWGFDIVRRIFDATGMDTTIVYLDALEMGIRAEYIEVLVSVKRGA